NELHALGYFGPADSATSTDIPEPSLLPDPKDKIEQQNLLHSGMLAAESHRFDQARRSFEKVLELDPASFTALSQLGQIELSEGNYKSSVDRLQPPPALRPDVFGFAFDSARPLHPLGQLPAAREALESSLKQNPTNLAARLLLARVDLDLKDARAAHDQVE